MLNNSISNSNSNINFEKNYLFLSIDEQKNSIISDISAEEDVINLTYKNNLLKFLGKKRYNSNTFSEKQIYDGLIEVFECQRKNELDEKNKENCTHDRENTEIFFNENSNNSLIMEEDKVEYHKILVKNRIELDSNAQSNNIINVPNKLEPMVFNKNKSDKQRLNPSEIITSNNEEEKKIQESKIKEQKEKNENTKKVEFQIEKKKNRGKERKSKMDGNSNIKIHSKNDYDNVITSIQVHYINFIIKLSNDILLSVYGNEKDLQFKDISYEFKKIINFNHFESLKSSSIKEILLKPISSKFKIVNNEDYNKELYEKIIGQSSWLNEFFDKNYLTLFKDYYFNKNKRLTQIIIKGKSIKLRDSTKSFFDLYIKSNEERKKLLINNINRAYFGVQETAQKNNLKTIIFKSSK